MRPKVIQDPVHGAIEADGVFLEILDRPEMQRLRSVRQLGLGCLVFPGANHTRFEHCLGTYHLAGRMAGAIGLDEDDSRAVRMAGLLHDVCHPPFSHAMEASLEEATGMDHMELAGALIRGDVPYFREQDSDVFGGLDTMAEVMEADGIDPGTVAGLIASPESVGEESLERFAGRHGHFPSKDYAHQIIHGPVDADQMDYLMRDAHHTGVCHGRIDCDRLVETMSVVNDRIVLNRGGVTAAEGLMVSRSLMYSAVYFHEATRIAQRMMAKAAAGAGVETGDLHLIGDSELEARVVGAGGRPSLEARRVRARRLDKKAFVLYGEETTEEAAEVLMGYAGRGGAERLEAEIASAAGADVMDVCAEVTSRTNLQGKMNIGKTDVAIADDSGRVRSLSRYSSIARALQSRDPYGWAVLVAAPPERVDAVSRASRRVLGLRSALDHADGRELGHLRGEPGVADHADDLVHVLVRLRGLLEHALDGPVPEVDAPLGHLPHDALNGQRVDGRLPGHPPPGAVARRPERLLHAAPPPGQDVRPDAHVARDDDGLPEIPVPHRHLGPAGGERAGGALPVHEDIRRVAVHVVALLLGDVVRHVVHHVHAHGLRGVAQDPLERLPDPVGDHLPVGPGVVRAAAHGAVVVVAQVRVQGRAGQLPVGKADSVPLDVALHLLEVVRRDLVAAAPRSAVDGDRDRPLPQAEGSRRPFVEDVLDHVELEEVVAGAEGAQLREAPLPRLVADLGRVGLRHAAVLLRRIQVLLPAVSVLHGPLRAVEEDLVQLLVSDPREALGPESGRHVPVQLVDELVPPPVEVLYRQVGPDQADPAVDVEPYAARGDGAGAGVHRGDAADGEAVAPVYVRHGHGAADDPGEAGDVGGLLRRVVRADA